MRYNILTRSFSSQYIVCLPVYTMNSIQKRFALFLFACIGSRISLVYYARIAPSTHLTYLAYLATIIASIFTILFIGDYRKTGFEVFGDRIWWTNLRPFHAFTYFLFAAMILSNYRPYDAWIILLVDVVVGFASFLWFHYSQGNFSRLVYTFEKLNYPFL
jgi:hypothetical protein